MVVSSIFVSSPCPFKTQFIKRIPLSYPSAIQKKPVSNLPFSSCSRRTYVRFSVQDHEEQSQAPTVSTISDPIEGEIEGNSSVETGEEPQITEEQQEVDWKVDEEFKKFMGNPSVEAAIKLEKKRAERKLKELSNETNSNPVGRFFSNVLRDSVEKERERLEKAQETFKALDLNKASFRMSKVSCCSSLLPVLKSCFGFDTFFVVDVRRFGDGGIFIGNLRKPTEEAIPKLEKKLSEAAGREVVVWLMQEEAGDIKKQVCMVQPKVEIDLQFETTKLSTPWGYVSAIALSVATFGTIALMSGFFLKPDATFDDYVADVLPLFGGFLTILGVSEIATRITAARYGVDLSPSFLVPSNWTGCLGVMNNYESLLPNKKALFDIPVARTASAYLTSLALAISAFVADGSFNGGDNALYIRPQFFYNNPLLSFIEFVIGPYSDDLGNVLPNAVEGLGVPVDPLAFAGLLGMVVTSLNLLPCGRLEGGRIAQALFGRSVAATLSFATSLLLGIGGLTGSVLCLAWGLFATFFRGGEELPAKDEITPIGDDRYGWGLVLAVICFLTLFPNGGGTFSSSFLNQPFFRGDM
ncbi:putative zinc metallopeptidase [Nymphaea thermarum]|nr:putative zinc metallopeptidase [Nymphaea thermarum]